jgi:hypothetical protein
MKRMGDGSIGTLDGSDQLHVPAALPPEKTPGNHWIRGLLGPRADRGSDKKNVYPRCELNLESPVVQPVLSTLCRLSSQ